MMFIVEWKEMTRRRRPSVSELLSQMKARARRGSEAATLLQVVPTRTTGGLPRQARRKASKELFSS